MSTIFIVLKILLILFCILVSVLLLILFIPFEYYLIGKINDRIEGKIEVRHIFGLFRIIIYKGEKDRELRINICKLGVYTKKIISKIDEKEQSKPQKGFKIRNIGKDLLKELINYLKDAFNLMKPKSLKIIGVYGFEDPSLTGMLLGLISMIDGITCAKIDLNPAFDEDIIDIKAEIYGDIRCYKLGYRTLKLMIRKDVRSLLKKSKNVETF